MKNVIIDEVELQERKELFDNWEWKVLTPEYKHGYLISIAMDVHTETSGEYLLNGFKTFSLADTVKCMDGDCSPLHFDLLQHPSYERANGQLVCFILAKGTEEMLCDWGYSEKFQRNIGLVWEF
ncbi:MAG: hypothetical protein WCW84_13810 [Sulfurimonas sp.]|jgi:hypothetical protein